MLDSFGRPPLAAHFHVRALELNQRSLRLLSHCTEHDPGWSRSIFASATAEAACWQALGPALTPPHWQAVRANLPVQDRLLRPLRAVEAGVLVDPETGFRSLARHARKAAGRRCLAAVVEQVARQGLAGLPRRQCRQLEEAVLQRSRWLGELARPVAGDESLARQGIVRVYRRARAALLRDPETGKARRRLCCLVWVQELMGEPSGPTEEMSVPDSPGGRLWKGLEEERWLRLLPDTVAVRDLGDKDTQRLSRILHRRRREVAESNRALMPAVVGDTEREFAARLPWLVFRHLAAVPGEPSEERG